jgi:hypothetical protein
MTVVFTAVSQKVVLMAVDSAVQLDFGTSREYDTGRKLWWFPGVGGVSTWGARDANHIGRFLEREWSVPGSRDVEALARDVHGFLVGEFAPDLDQRPDVGFHVAGFTKDGYPRLFHSFWNTPRDVVTLGSYTLQLATPPAPKTAFFYNGRNDLAERVVGALLEDVNTGRDTRFNHRTVGGIAYFAHMVLRFAAEISREGSPPFLIRLMVPSGRDVLLRYDSLQWVPLNEFDERCADLQADIAAPAA